MLSSISTGTIKQYTTTYKSWWSFCQSHQLDIYNATVPDVIHFLTEKHKKNIGFNALNTARSALALLINEKIGSDAQIKRFFRGLFRIKPALRRYVNTWDPSIVLRFLTNWKNNEELDLVKLSKKVVTLLALATAQRVQTLSVIKLQDLSISQNVITIHISDLIKTSISSKTETIIKLPFFEQDPVICPARALQAYIKITSTIRKDEKYLIISSRQPHKRASKQTISRWIKTVMKESGIDTEIFTSHSTRHAATSSAKRAGIPLDVIRKTAGWSESSYVFARFYDLPINNNAPEDSFMKAVFTSNSK